MPARQQDQMPLVTGPPRAVPPLVIRHRDALLEAGESPQSIRRQVSSHSWTPIRRGAYGVADELAAMDQWNRYRITVLATAPKLRPGSVLSHVSAAVLHGFAVWPNPRLPLHVTRNGSGGGRRSGTLWQHRAALYSDEIVEIDSVPITSVARTILDLARTSRFETGVIVADQALRHGLTTKEVLVDQLDRHRYRSGLGKAKRVVTVADGHSESVGESLSRVVLRGAGLEFPALQYQVHDQDGYFVARLDFADPGARIAGEFDGRLKYRAGFEPGVSPDEVVAAERQRQQRLEGLGWIVVRWRWRDLERPDQLADRIRRAYALRAV